MYFNFRLSKFRKKCTPPLSLLRFITKTAFLNVKYIKTIASFVAFKTTQYKNKSFLGGFLNLLLFYKDVFLLCYVMLYYVMLCYVILFYYIIYYYLV